MLAQTDLNSLQNLALIFSLQFAWPEKTYRYSQMVLPVVLFGISDSIHPTCVTRQWTWAHGYLLQMCLLPTALLLLLTVEARTRFGRNPSDPNNETKRCKAWGFFFTYIDVSYVAVVLMSFQALTCREESDGNAYLVVAPSIMCYRGLHRIVSPLAVFGVFGVGLGCT